MSKKSIFFWNIMSLFFIIGVPILNSMWIGVWPSGKEFIKSIISIVLLFYPAAIISTIPYISTIGLYGTYLSFVTGNISNIKLPCALNALDLLENNCSQEHKDCMVTVAVTVSNIVSLIVISISIFGLIPYTADIMDLPVLTGGKQILAALFGALGISCFSKNKAFSVVLVLGLTLSLVIDGTLSTTELIFIAISIIMVYSFIVSFMKYNNDNQK